MLIHCQYTFDDYREALAAFRAHKKRVTVAAERKNIPKRILTFIITMLVIGYPMFVSFQMDRTPILSGICLGWLAGIFATFGFLLLVGRIQQKKADRKLWGAQPRLSEPRTITIASTMIIDAHPVVRTEHHWTSFLRYFDTPNLFVLSTDANFLMIPKRFLDPAQRVELQSLCANFLSGQNRGFPVLLAGAPPVIPQNNRSRSNGA